MQPTPEQRYQDELLLSRTILRNEMQKALLARTADQKRELVKVWREVYKPEVVAELLRVAQNPEAKYRIANWNLRNFETERRKGIK